MKLWLCCRLAAAALISLSWELPYTTGVALKRNGKKEEGKKKSRLYIHCETLVAISYQFVMAGFSLVAITQFYHDSLFVS